MNKLCSEASGTTEKSGLKSELEREGLWVSGGFLWTVVGAVEDEVRKWK